MQREYLKEQQAKALFQVTPDDDAPQTIYKIFEQIRVLNSDLTRQLEYQKTKRKAVEDFERRLIKEEEYEMLVNELNSYDDALVSVSLQFSDLTKEAKRIIDEAKAASEQRKD